MILYILNNYYNCKIQQNDKNVNEGINPQEEESMNIKKKKKKKLRFFYFKLFPI